MKYKTKHRQALLQYLQSIKGRHITVSDIRAYFQAKGAPIGTTTLYRQVDELVQAGFLQKYIVDENSAACFEYTGESAAESGALHCKCEACGHLSHLACLPFSTVQQHLAEAYGFTLNPGRTVLYGLCAACQQKAVNAASLPLPRDEAAAR